MTGNYTPPPGTIEVLEWLPREIAPGWPAGLWHLQAIDAFLDPDLTERDVASYEAGIDADTDILGTWAAGVLGFPVRLTAEEEVIEVPLVSFPGRTRAMQAINMRLPGRRIPRRLYWVTPA